jgi:hypothetical protein
MKGNHSWVEIWIEGEWYFTEYYPDDLNKSWFLTDAGRADEVWINLALYSSKLDRYLKRVSEKISLMENSKEVDFGYSPSQIVDLNKYLKLNVRKNVTYQSHYTDSNGVEKQTEIAVQDHKDLFKLFKE